MWKTLIEVVKGGGGGVEVGGGQSILRYDTVTFIDTVFPFSHFKIIIKLPTYLPT